MLKNYNHDLVHQLSEISDSVWRIEKYYLDSSKECKACQEIWENLKNDYKKHISILSEEIKKHSTEGKFE